MRDRFVTGIATILWALKWADHCDGHKCHKLSGCKIEEHMPPIPDVAWEHAEKIAATIQEKIGSWQECFRLAMVADEISCAVSYDGVDAQRFGECLYYAAAGHGVSWLDDHEDFTLPNGVLFSKVTLYGCGTDEAEMALEDYAAESCQEKGTGVRCKDCGAYNDPDQDDTCEGCGASTHGSVSVDYIDTCFPDYLTDHHNREGECLVGIQLGATDPVGDLVGEVEGVEHVPDWVTGDAFRDAFAAAVRGVDFRPFDGSGNRVDKVEDDDDDDKPAEEQSTVWFVVRWSAART